MKAAHLSAPSNAVPRGLLIAAAGLVVVSLLLVGTARITGYTPDRPDASPAAAAAELRFVDRQDGAVLVYAAQTAQLIDVLPPGTNGFVRGVLRGLVRDRNALKIDARPPFRLTRWADGRLSLDDMATGRHVDLEVFGPTNAGAFADILIASDAARATANGTAGASAAKEQK
jgi:putative photosynthetic complex assembly protein